MIEGHRFDGDGNDLLQRPSIGDGRNSDSSRENKVATHFEAYNGLTEAVLTGRYQRFLNDDNRWLKIDVITLMPANQRSISVHLCQTVGPKSCK